MGKSEASGQLGCGYVRFSFDEPALLGRWLPPVGRVVGFGVELGELGETVAFGAGGPVGLDVVEGVDLVVGDHGFGAHLDEAAFDDP